MNELDGVVIEVIKEPYYRDGMWCVEVLVDVDGIVMGAKYHTSSYEDAICIGIGFRFLV